MKLNHITFFCVFVYMCGLCYFPQYLKLGEKNESFYKDFNIYPFVK